LGPKEEMIGRKNKRHTEHTDALTAHFKHGQTAQRN